MTTSGTIAHSTSAENIAEEWADLNGINPVQAAGAASLWFLAGKDEGDDTADALRTFLRRRFLREP